MNQNTEGANSWATVIFAITLFVDDLEAAKQFSTPQPFPLSNRIHACPSAMLRERKLLGYIHPGDACQQPVNQRSG